VGGVVDPAVPFAVRGASPAGARAAGGRVEVGGPNPVDRVSHVHGHRRGREGVATPRADYDVNRTEQQPVFQGQQFGPVPRRRAAGRGPAVPRFAGTSALRPAATDGKEHELSPEKKQRHAIPTPVTTCRRRGYEPWG